MATENAFYISGGKTADIALAYARQDIVIFDFAREQEERVNYHCIEKFKDGLMWSPKYNSKTKIFRPPRVLVFSNFEPDVTKLSADRWDLHRPVLESSGSSSPHSESVRPSSEAIEEAIDQ